MVALKFASSHNMVAFLDKPTKSDGFEQITITKVKTVNGKVKIQALVDKKKVIVTETSIRSDLQLEDAEVFFSPQWKFHIHTILQCLSAKTTAWNEFSSTMASAVILFLDKQVEGMSKHKKIYVTPSHTKKVFANMKRQGKDYYGRDTPLFPTMIVQAQEQEGEGSIMPIVPQHAPTINQPSTSKPQKKQSRRKQRKDTKVSQPSGPTEPMADETKNVESVPTHSNDPLLSGEERLKLNELVELCTNLSQRVLDLENTKTSQAAEITKLKEGVKKLERMNKSRTLGLKRLRKGRKIVDLDTDVKVTLVDEAQGRTKPKAVIIATTTTTTAVTRPKARGVVDQEPKELQAELEEEERLARQKKEDANIAECDNVQAMIDADYELAARLHAQEQEELTIEERSKMFVELMDKRKKHFARLKAEE
ncbi:hypothetical protein Tco_0517922 [Tanacetum coccineum]